MKTLLVAATVAAICAAGAVQAQSGARLDPNAPQPMAQPQQANLPTQGMAQPEANFRDEYGNLYNSRGDRIGGRTSLRMGKAHVHAAKKPIKPASI